MIDPAPPATAARPALPRRVGPALERLVLSATVQDIAGLKRPPKLARRPRLAAFAAWLLGVADRRLGLNNPTLTAPQARRLYTVLVVALRLASGTLRAKGVRTIGEQVRHCVEEHGVRTRAVAGYAATSSGEHHAIRIALLLRMMKRRVQGVRVIADRIRTSLDSPRARRLAAGWLADIGEGKVAAMLTESGDGEARPAPMRGAAVHAPRRLRYGVVILTMFDTEIFRTSVRSLLASDFSGDVVVVEEGNEPDEACREFCASVGVRYVKSPAWDGCAAGINLGIRQLPAGTDIVISSHNDVLWPRAWFRELDRIWDSVWDGDRVGLLNLSYLQINPRVDPALTDLFLQGEYDDLVWLLRSLREIPSMCDQVQDVEVKAGESPFGLARDPWVDWMPDLRQQTGRYSVGASFPMRVWQEIGGFDPDLVYAFDLQFLHHSLQRRRWAFFIDTPPLVHLKSSDTEHIAPERLASIGTRFLSSTYDGFRDKYGWHIEHFLNVYFSESAVVHRDAILSAANGGRFDDIDFVFDDFADRLKTRTLANCELTWCRSRAQCPYA